MTSNSQSDIEFAVRASPNNWMDYANELKESLDILWETNNNSMMLNHESSSRRISKKPSVSRPWLLIASFTIENLLKGLIIAENPEFISNGKLSSKVVHHNLDRLVNIISNLELAQAQTELVHILESCLPYWGRYPVPLRAEEIEEETFASLDLYSAFEQLYRKLDMTLYNRNKNGWKGPHKCKFSGSFRSEYEDLPENHQNMTFDELIKWRDSNN